LTAKEEGEKPEKKGKGECSRTKRKNTLEGKSLESENGGTIRRVKTELKAGQAVNP